MSQHDEYSIEQLSAFVDNELDANERARILAAAQQDKTLSDEINTLQQYNDLIRLSYMDTASSIKPTVKTPKPFYRYTRMALAASVLLAFGFVIGFQLTTSSNTGNPIQSLAQINPDRPPQEKILIHINAMDTDRIDETLSKTELLLDSAKNSGKPLQLEIVVNASGINMLRVGSPYSDQIHSLTERYDNVSFLACGFAMENIRMKEGADVELVPEAKKVDAALEQILRRLKSGWLYLRS